MPGYRLKDKYYGGDKTSDGQGFTAFYEALLAPLRHQPHVHFLEVGVWYGKSLAMWADFFGVDGSPSGTCTIHGVDIHLGRFYEHRPELERQGAFRRNTVELHEVDTASDGFEGFARDALPELHAVLDDGCHTAASQWRCLQLLFPRLRPGGLYIIEDIESSAAFFSNSSSSCFGALLAAAANPNYFTSAAVMAECEAATAAAEAAVVTQSERAVQGLQALEAQLQGNGGRRSTAISVVGSAGGGSMSDHAKMERAATQRREEVGKLAATLEARKASARREARRALQAQMAVAREIAAQVACVEVRRMNVVIRKKEAPF